MSFRDIVGPRRPWGLGRQPRRRVTAEAAVLDPRGWFAFYLPWPWFEEESEAGTPGPGQDGRIVLSAPRTAEPRPRGWIRSRKEIFELDFGQLTREARDEAAKVGGKHYRPRRLSVGDVGAGTGRTAPAAHYFVETDDLLQHHLEIAGPHGTTHVVFKLPLAAADGYGVHVETMLATWHWH